MNINIKAMAAACGRHCAVLAVTTTAGLLATAPAPGRDAPWESPEFRQSFLASYGFDGPREPAISESEKELFQRLIPLLENEQFGAAAAQLQDALRPDSSAAVPFTLGNIYFQSGELDAAERAYRQAIERFPGFRRAQQNLGFSLVRQGRLEEALPALLEAARAGGGGGALYGLIGYAYLGSARPASALPAYEQALMFQPDSLDWRLGRAQALFATGDYRQAAAVAEEVLQEVPERADIWFMQANAMLALGDAEEAAANLEIVRRMGKADAPSLLLLGDIYLNRNLPDLAWPAYRQALRMDLPPEPERALRAARGLADRQAWTQAQSLAALVEANYRTRLSPAQATELKLLRAEIDLARGADTQAVELLETLLRNHPMHGRALLLLGKQALKQDDFERAQLMFKRAAELPVFEAEARVQSARALVGRRHYKEAVRELERAQAIQPRDTVARFLENVRAAARRDN